MESSSEATSQETDAPCILQCPFHGDDYISYCTDCDEFTCNKCLNEHNGHTMVDLFKKVSPGGLNLSDEEISTFPLRSRLILQKYEPYLEETERQIHLTETKLQKLQTKRVGANDYIQYESDVLDETCKELYALKSLSRSKTVRHGLIKCLETLNVRDLLKNEYEQIERDFKATAKYLKQLASSAMRLRIKIDILQEANKSLICARDTIREITKHSAHNMLNVFCVEPTIFTDPDHFAAFRGVSVIPEVQESLAEKDLVETPLGCRVTKVIQFKRLPTPPTSTNVSLSPTGILAMNDVSKGQLLFVNLRTWEQIAIEGFTKETSVGMYDCCAIALVVGEKLMEAELELLFETPAITSFTKMKQTKEVAHWMDTSVIHTTRSVIYTTFYRQKICIYDVDRHQSTTVHHCALSHASLTGIHIPGVKSVFSDFSGNIMILKGDLTVERLKQFKERGSVAVVLPSSAQAKELGSALIFMRGRNNKGIHKVHYCYMKRDVECSDKWIPFSPQTSLVRLYKDVFLSYNQAKLQWGVFRIQVP